MLLKPHLFTVDENQDVVDLTSKTLFSPAIYVVSRANCSFRRESLKAKSASALKAVRFKAEKQAANPHTKIRIEKDKKENGVGIWSFEPPTDQAHRALPETLARIPLQDGIRLVQCLQGFEGQVWKSGDLLASRWWPIYPNERAWQTFLRVVDVDLETLPGVPEAQDIPFRTDLPLFDFNTDSPTDLLSPARVLKWGGIVFTIYGAILGGRYLHYNFIKHQTETKLKSVSASAAKVLSQRRRAFANMKTAQRFNALQENGQILRAISALATVLGREPVQILSMKFTSGDVEIRLKGQLSKNIPDLVGALEAQDVFSGVNINQDRRDGFLIKARLGTPSTIKQAGS